MEANICRALCLYVLLCGFAWLVHYLYNSYIARRYDAVAPLCAACYAKSKQSKDDKKKAKSKDKGKNKKEQDSVDEAPATDAVAGDEGTAITISVTPAAPRTYFADIDSNIVHNVELGSPSSLRAAMSALQMLPDLPERGRELYAVADGIMRMVWKSENVTWKAAPATGNNPYTGAIASAASGIYDTSTGNTDFLTYVLPSLVIVDDKAERVAGYAVVAEAALNNALQKVGDSVLANYLLALLYIKRGQQEVLTQSVYQEKALPLLRKASRSAPDCKEVLSTLAGALSATGHTDEASSFAAALAARWPNDMEVLQLCAETAYTLKRYNEAENYVARCLQQEPNNTQFLLFRAKILVALGDYIRAMSMLDICGRTDSNSRDYLLLRAIVQRDWSKNLSAAIVTIETALVRYPKDAELLIVAASLAAGTGGNVGGRSAAALADEALILQPTNDEALHYKIDALAMAGKWAEAYNDSAPLMARNPSREAIFTHIRICLNLKKGDEAWELISPLYKEDSQNEDVLQSYVEVLSATGRTDQAIALIDRELPAASPKMRSFYYYRRSLMQRSEEAALADLRSALIASPRNADALFRLYQIYYQNRDYRKAQYYLKQVIAIDRGNASMRKLDEDLQRLIK